MKANVVGRSGAFAVALCLFAGCVIPLPIVGGGIAGAGADPLWIRNEAHRYPAFQASSVRISKIMGLNVPSKEYSREKYFSDFENRAQVANGVPARLHEYELYFSISRKAEEGIRIRVALDRHDLIQEKIPRAFYMSDLQVATMHCGHESLILLAANSRTHTGRMWLGIFTTDGRKLFAASLPQNVAHIAPRECSIAVLQRTGAGLLIGAQ